MVNGQRRLATIGPGAFPGLAMSVAALVLLVCAMAAAQGPQRLPPPDVPVEQIESADTLPPPSTAPDSKPKTLPASQPRETYIGPPATIDGPQRLPPPNIEVLPEEIPHGYVPEDYLPEDHVPLPGSPLEGEFDDELYYEGPQKLSAYKNGFFQKLSLSAAWLGDSNAPNDLGVTEIEAFVTVALPAPIREWPLLITPGYNMIFIDGGGITDLPPRLNTAYIDFMWVPNIINRFSLVLSVAPSVYTDFQASDPDMFRVTGKALVLYDWVPDRLQVIAGVLYLGRDDVMILPAGGVIWMPADWTRFELLFPKPKLATRLNVGHGYEDWVYATAEFGGNTWSIERTSGLDDKVTYLDYRAVLGFERKLNGGAGYRLEGGYVFGRSITFASGLGDFDPQDTWMLRGGLTY